MFLELGFELIEVYSKMPAMAAKKVPTKKLRKKRASPKKLVSPPDYGSLVQVSEEKDSRLLDKLQPVANDHKAALLALIAPFSGKKISPVDWISASIRLWEELGIEQVVRNINKKYKGKKLFLLIESPGGTVSSSYKIASYLRKNFSEIIVFVPHQAASGGTLIAIGGNKIVLGDMANLTPIDIQTKYAGTTVSVNRMSSALARLNKFFETKLPQQVPYPYRSLVDKLDPIIYDDWETKTYEMAAYAADLLTKAGYEEESRISIISKLVYSAFPHSFVIDRTKARNYGLDVAKKGEFESELNCMHWWLKNYMVKPGMDHYIRYIIPNK